MIVGVRDQCIQKLAAVAEVGGELIECSEICAGHVAHFKLPDLAEFARECGVLLRLIANDVDIFQAGVAIEPEARQILPEKSKAFAKKKDRNQGEDNDRDQRVAAEERFDG